MTYSETLDYLFHSLPMYHRVGAAAYKADIKPTEELMSYLGHPEQQFKSVHIAGTNGKGSVSHFLASILQQSGLKVGLYTSPHLVDFRERIRINGEMIPRESVCAFVDAHRQKFEQLHLSFFEMTVGLAFHYFAQQQVDIAIVEVGMGGRLDSTNVIKPLLSVITNIGLDHTQFLGANRAAIAGEKAGIIKEGVPVVIGETHPETEAVFRQVAAEKKSPILFADQHYRLAARDTVADDGLPLLEADLYHEGVLRLSGLRSPLAGAYQHKNLVTLIAALDTLRPQLSPHVVTDDHIITGVRQVIAQTGLHGRWEVIGQHPLVICETAHNFDGIQNMLQQLGTLHFRHLHLIYGCVNDKNFGEILQYIGNQFSQLHFPYSIYYTQPSVPRALPVEQLAHAAETMGMSGSLHPDVHAAIATARAAAHADDLILVTGSIFLVADAMEPILGK